MSNILNAQQRMSLRDYLQTQRMKMFLEEANEGINSKETKLSVS